MGRFLNLSVPQFPHLQYGGNHTAYVIGLFTRAKGDNTHKALGAILGICLLANKILTISP